MSLVSLSDLKLFLGITDNSQDALLTMFQTSVEQSIINFCETDFTIKTVTNELSDGIRSDVITPKNYPITAVDAVIFNVDPDGSDGYTLDPAFDYTFNESAIYLRGQHTPFSRAIVRIDYKYGYSAVPADVKMCVYQSVKAELQRYERKTEDLASRSKQDESESYGGGGGNVWDSLTGLPKTIVAKLQYYKSYEFPHAGMAQRNI